MVARHKTVAAYPLLSTVVAPKLPYISRPKLNFGTGQCPATTPASRSHWETLRNWKSESLEFLTSLGLGKKCSLGLAPLVAA